MKKLLSVVLATLMILGVFPLVLPQTVIAENTPERIAYLDAENGTDVAAEEDATLRLGDPNKAFKYFDDAYNALCPAGGTILFTAPYGYEETRVIGLKTHYGEIKITANGNMDNYWMLGLYDESTPAFIWYSVKFGGPVLIDDICLLDVEGVQEYIFANFNRLVIGENVQCTKATMSGTEISSKTQHTAPSSNGIAICGGALSCETGVYKRDTSVTVKSGYWRAISGGSRHEGTSKVASYDGTFRVNFEGGATNYIIGGNWGGGAHCGGQFYVSVSGGLVKNIYLGSQDDYGVTLRNSFLIWTGGVIGNGKQDGNFDIVTGKSDANITLLYGGDVEVASASTSAFDSDKNGCYVIPRNVGSGFVSGGVTTGITYKKNLNVIKLPEGNNPIVYVDQANGSAYGDGSEGDPVNSYLTAMAMLSQTGGTIKLLSNYTMSNLDCSAMYSFREPDHANPIVVDGQDYSFSKEDANGDNTVIKNTRTFSSPRGFDNYILSGDTTFTNIVFDFASEVNFSANYNKLVMDTGVVRENPSIGIFLLGGNYYPRDYIEDTETYVRRDAYNASFEPYYADWSDADTSITVRSGRFWVSAFSRLVHAINSGNAKYGVHYGNGTVNIEGGTVTNLYGAPTNSSTATAENVTINISAGSVDTLFCGGASTTQGIITGSATANISGNASVSAFSNVNTCDNYTLNVNNDYATYLAAKGAVGSFATVKSEILAPVFGDSDFGVRYDSEGSYSLRYVSDILAAQFEEYNIVELGVFVKLRDNENAFAYFNGKESFRGISEDENVNNVNTDTKIAKSVVYVKDKGIDRYMWAGEGDTTVDYVAPLVELDVANSETEFAFRPYIVIVGSNGAHERTILGETAYASISAIVDEILNGADPENYTDKQAIAAQIQAEIR
ncbi:MAG: hypothetical protein IJF74_02715 [Clostridia bacterium]|nr:hypothetical protein [Clostridia bacterium]